MKKRLALFLCLLLCVGPPSGCHPAPPPAASGGSRTDAAESRTGAPEPADSYAKLWERIDGSTATIPLTEGIMSHMLRISPEEAAQRVAHSKTYGAYHKLIYQQADLIFVTAPAEDWLKEAAEQGGALEVIPVVKDALVFLANTLNPVESLTQRQLVDIYTGKITNWEAVGGADAAVKPFQRPASSGSQTLFLQLLMKDVPPTQAAPELELMHMGGLIDAVAAYDNARSALGYSVFYYATDMYLKDEVKLLAVDGIQPTKKTIMAGEYPLITYYYAVVRKDTPADHPARRMIAWLLGEEGRRVAEEAGYVPLL